jgi:hypothetical protein
LAQNCNQVNEWKDVYSKIHTAAKQKGIPVWLVTAESAAAEANFPGHQILKGDATVIKTAARVVPTYFLMEGATIRKKMAGARVNDLTDLLP